MVQKDRVILIDGHSLAHRAYWALPALQAADGTPTGAIYGFVSMLIRLIQEKQPTHLAVAFDRAEPTFRHVEFDGYKAQRSRAPDDFRVQIPLLKQVLEGLGAELCEKEGYEADDILGYLTREAVGRGAEVLIVTGDRDALQLVNEQTRVMLNRKGISDMREYDAAAVRREFGIDPPQVPDVKGLMGDPSDNIPGVPGIGEKTAFRLIQRWGSLENVLDHVDEVEENRRVREALRTYRDQALMSKRLATIVSDIPLEVRLEDCRWKAPDLARVEKLFHALELRTLWERLHKTFGPSASQQAPAVPPLADVESNDTAPAGGLGERGPGERGPGEQALGELLVVERAGELAAAFARLGSPPLLGVAAWLEGPHPLRAELAGLVLAGKETSVYVSGRIPWAEAQHYLRPLLENAGVGKAGHDLKPLLLWFLGKGITVKGLALDSLLAAYLLDPTRSGYPLPHLAREYLDRRLQGAEEIMGKGRNAVQLSLLPVRVAADFLGAQAAACRDLCTPMRAELEVRGLTYLLDQVEMPLLPVLAEMEYMGVRVDLGRIDELAREFGARIEAVTREIYDLAGCAFNINSTHQLQEVLFGRLGLPAKHKTKTGYSTGAEALEELRTSHPIVEKILEHRTLVKLKGTYLDGMPALVDPGNGRVHTTFNQAVTATGRLSSNDPNLQNIPVRDELGRRIRQAFVPAEGRVLLSADYSQIELRLLAHVSRDPSLIEAFRTGEDIHRRTAAEVFGVSLEQVTDDMRSRAKAVNFGIVYGISDFGLSQQLGISRNEAREYITSYFLRYPGVRAWVDEVLAQARAQGYVTTLLGRRRQLPGISSRNPQERGFAERTAINTPLQGSAADIIKLAMVRLHGELAQRGLASRLILQVHDELILEVPGEELPVVAGLVRTAMEEVLPLEVPLQVDLKAGPSWYDLSPLPRTV